MWYYWINKWRWRWHNDEEFNALFNELADSECDISAEEYVDFDVERCSSLPPVNYDMVDWRVSSVIACVTEYLRKECGDLNEVASDNDDDKDDDDANSKDVEIVEIRWSTNNAWQVSKPERPIKGIKELSCRHERQIREYKRAEQKAKEYQWLFYVRIKFEVLKHFKLQQFNIISFFIFFVQSDTNIFHVPWLPQI